MQDFLFSLFGFLVMISLVIGIHEYGHFITARILRIKVLRFSIGFGKVLFRKKDKNGIEYALSAIPIGGYVKLLDENEGKVKKQDLPSAFNRQPPLKKIAVVTAGVIFNMVLAIVIYWGLFSVGVTSFVAKIGEVTPHSIAADAGLKSGAEIVSVNNKNVSEWQDAVLRLVLNYGDKKPILIATQNPQTKKITQHSLDISNWHFDDLQPDILSSLGIKPFQPNIPAIIGKKEKLTSAEKSQLKTGDKVLAFNDKPIKDWYDFVAEIQKTPEKNIQLKIMRDKKTQIIAIKIGFKKKLFSKKIGVLGVMPEFTPPESLFKTQKYSFFKAFFVAIRHAFDLLILNFILFAKIITGKVSLKGLAGPITIFSISGIALKAGMINFLNYLAFINIALAFANILPIPGLDGGFLCIYLFELITRKEISQRMQEFLYRIGIAIILLIFVQAIFNDVMRLLH